MRTLQKIQSQHIVAIDVETVRVSEHYEDLSEGFKSAWEYKNKFEGRIPTEQELSDSWLRTSSLYTEFSKICAVSITFLHGGKLFCKEFYGKNEKALLEALAITLNNISAKSSDYRLAGHASKYFDYPFLCKRFIVNGMQLPDLLEVTTLKPWEQRNLCTNELWKVGGTGSGSSLQALCNVLDIPVSKVDLVGDEVGTAYFNNELERIGRYCSYDTIATFNILRKFKYEPIFQFDEVEYKLGYSDDTFVTEQLPTPTPLKDIYNSDYFSDQAKQQLSSKFPKKLTKKDRETIKTILEAIYIRSEFQDTDNLSVQTAKKSEIEEFVKTLK